MELVIFDFDDTIVNTDTDHLTIEFIKDFQVQIQKINEENVTPWTDLMANVFKILYDQGFRADDYRLALTSPVLCPVV